MKPTDIINPKWHWEAFRAANYCFWRPSSGLFGGVISAAFMVIGVYFIANFPYISTYYKIIGQI